MSFPQADAAFDELIDELKSRSTLMDELTFRVKELGVENEDLRKICIANGINPEETLAANRHRRYF